MARAFVAFQTEAKWARDFLVQHAKDKNNEGPKVVLVA